MQPFPKRTNCTAIGDNTLLLMDLLAMLGPAPASSLELGNYQLEMNCTYAHTVPSSYIECKLNHMITASLVKKIPVFDERTIWYGLTSYGAAIWDLERAPLWHRFCSASFPIEDGEFSTVSCGDPTIGKDFVAYINQKEYKIIFPELEEIKFVPVDGQTVLYWRNQLPPFYECKFMVEHTDDPFGLMNYHQDDGYREYYEDENEGERTWWTTLADLQKFLP